MIVIDPGHGGSVKVGNSSPNNATGPAGTLEKALTLDLGLRTQTALLLRGLPVRLTRDADVNLGLQARAAVARAARAPVFVSIHFNGASDRSIQGTETWVHAAASDSSRRLAAAVQQALLAVSGYRNRGVRSKELGVLSPLFHDSATASCLAEVSFLTDPADEDRLRDDDYKTALGAALAEGVGSYLAGEQARLSSLLESRPAAALELNVPAAPAAPIDVPSCSDDRARTPLMAAAAHGHRDIASLLLGAGAGVDAKNSDGWTALTFAAAGGHVEIVKLLLAHGARVDGAAEGQR
jgi:N-acetylmuramoyl-L-alanine amidase